MLITEEMIQKAIDHGACDIAINWLKVKPRTWKELVKHNSDWAVWVMAYIPDCPINLEGLDSYGRALVMINRQDCPVDLDSLEPHDRDWVIRGRGLAQ